MTNYIVTYIWLYITSLHCVMILINLQGVMHAWLQLRAHEQNIAISSSVYSVLYAVTINLCVLRSGLFNHRLLYYIGIIIYGST